MVMYLRRASTADLARLAGQPDETERFVFPENGELNDPDLVDFDKAWHALHFMLTGAVYGDDSPLGVIAGDAEPLYSQEMGIPDAWVISPSMVKAFDAALQSLDDAALATRFDVDAMLANDIYIADAFVGDDEAVDYVMQGVPALRRMASTAAAAGDGMIRLLA